jgi:hypothetical protein
MNLFGHHYKKWTGAKYMLLQLGLILATVLILAFGITPVSADDPPIPTQDVVFNATFQTSGQSMWAQGSSPNDIDVPVPIISTGWDESGSTSNFKNFFGAQVGGSMSGSTSGELGVSARFHDIGSGSIDITYPVQVKLTTPGPGSFEPGDTITISSSATLLPGYKFSTTPAQGKLDINGVVGIGASASAKIRYPKVSGDHDFSVEEKNINFFPPINEGVNDNIVSTASTVAVTISPYETLLHGISGTYGLPNVSTSASIDGDGKSLVASGSHTFVNLNVDMDKWSGLPLGFATPHFSGVPAEFGYEILDASTRLSMTQSHQFKFTPVVEVSLAFPQDVQYKVKNGSVIVEEGTSALIKFNAGHSIEIVYPEIVMGTFSITPTFSLKNNFSNSTTTTFKQSLTTKSLELSLKIPGFKLWDAVKVQITHWTPTWDDWDKHHHHWVTIIPALSFPTINLGTLGPLFSKTIAEYSVPNTFLFDQDRPPWELTGFNDVTKPAFDLLGVQQEQHPPSAVITVPDMLYEGQAGVLPFSDECGRR